MTTLILSLLACAPEAPTDTPAKDAPAALTTPAIPVEPSASNTTTPPSMSSPLYVSPRCDALAERPDGRTTFYETNPTYEDPTDHAGPYATVPPEKVGLSKAMLQDVSDQLGTHGFVQSFLVFVDGELAWEHYGKNTAPTDSHNIHSASKSLLATAVGIAIDAGHLQQDDTLGRWLPDATADLSQAKQDITVRQLLEMTAGFEWVEDETEAEIEKERDWVRAILEQSLVAEPGTRFNYNTGQTHLLSAVLQEATGRSTCDYVHEVLLDPLDIDAEHWGRDPQGIYSGGYNVYMTPRELARFGLMIDQGGQWEGEQVVPRPWVQDMLSRHQTDDPYGYGLLWWNRPIRGHQVQIAWGYGGQFIYLVPDLDLMVVVTTDTHDHDPWFWDAEYVLYGALIPALER